MKVLCSLMAVLVLRQAVIAGIVRKSPAFSRPVYSNSYLPAAMQVIFHAVEQLKLLQSEEVSQGQTTIQSMKHSRPSSTTPGAISTVPTAAATEARDEATEAPAGEPSASVTPAMSRASTGPYDGPTEAVGLVDADTASIPIAFAGDHAESPEVNEETTETNYATPETNHETPESAEEVWESSREIPRTGEEGKSSTTVGTTRSDDTSRASHGERKKAPTIDSVVDEVYGILKPTTSPLLEESDVADESLKLENIEDEEDETRFTLLGEKVTQVPRPSLSGYLRRAKVPPGRALQQLAGLYDAFSKDARKQGFARFAGYSDEVLTTLQSTAEGGVGPQLKRLLEKVVERNELTRDDAKTRASEALRDLDNPASALNKDLRRLLPLRYVV